MFPNASALSPLFPSISSILSSIPDIDAVHLSPTRTPSNESTAVNAAAAAAAMPPANLDITVLAGDVLSHVFSYLPQEERAQLRKLNDDDVRRAADLSIETLNTTPEEFQNLLATTRGLPRLHAVRLHNWHSDNLRTLAVAMRNLRPDKIHLTLDRPSAIDAATASADGVEALAGVRLGSLTLDNVVFLERHRDVLSNATFPISIDLWQGRDSNAYAATQLPTLHSLRVTAHSLDANAVDALSTHPSLRSFDCINADTAIIRRVMENPRIQSLTIGQAVQYAQEDNTWLSHHPSLVAVYAQRVNHPDALAALSMNQGIRWLTLDSPAPECYAALPQLANISALHSLSIHGESIYKYASLPPIVPAQLDAICRKPLQSLSFSNIALTPATFELISKASSAHLSVTAKIDEITDGAIDHFVHNQVIRALSLEVMGGWHSINTPGGAAQLASHPPLEKLTLRLRSNDETNDSIREAWQTAHKPLTNLNVNVRRPFSLRPQQST